MKTGAIHRDGACLIPTVWRADNPWTRFRGLLGRRPLQGEAREAMLLAPCNSVHTLAMRYALDLIFLDANGQVIDWYAGLRPWRVKTRWKARQTVELSAGGLARLHPERGQRWTWQPT